MYDYKRQQYPTREAVWTNPRATTSMSVTLYSWLCSILSYILSMTRWKYKTQPLQSTAVNNKSYQPSLSFLSRQHQTAIPPEFKKTLILDLDETLVHSTIKPVTHHHMNVDVIIDGRSCTFYVIKRPHVDNFLVQVSEWFDVIIFTASMKQYADPLIDQLDKHRVVKGRLFRESCLVKDGNFIKDLGMIGQELSSTILVDNSPIAYSNNKDNALPIENWMGDNPQDDALLNLIPFLSALRYTSDVRSILSLRGG
eukprot:TRINITY_DN3216_c0_g1_i1.p1 TRINITY_DN3216_c0_g1~~TRINITY_DN3216_c0_g1_i1.p1  ORF type:complete len:254 (+),score=37.43 TRINITY_DN3216_c0_g1_i1:160-921(+)